MRIVALTVAAGALLAATQANAGSFPVNGRSAAGNDLVDQVAVRVYVHGGRHYCFYFNGWHGPGWYRCGFAFRRGLGWGGAYGWNDWTYGPYERRFGGRFHDHDRIGVERSNRTNSSVETHTPATTSGGVQTGTRARGDTTTGSGPGVDVQSGGGAKVQGGASGAGASTRGGGTVGSGPRSDQEGSKRQ